MWAAGCLALLARCARVALVDSHDQQDSGAARGRERRKPRPMIRYPRVEYDKLRQIQRMPTAQTATLFNGSKLHGGSC